MIFHLGHDSVSLCFSYLPTPTLKRLHVTCKWFNMIAKLRPSNSSATLILGTNKKIVQEEKEWPYYDRIEYHSLPKGIPSSYMRLIYNEPRTVSTYIGNMDNLQYDLANWNGLQELQLTSFLPDLYKGKLAELATLNLGIRKLTWCVEYGPTIPGVFGERHFHDFQHFIQSLTRLETLNTNICFDFRVLGELEHLKFVDLNFNSKYCCIRLLFLDAYDKAWSFPKSICRWNLSFIPDESFLAPSWMLHDVWQGFVALEATNCLYEQFQFCRLPNLLLHWNVWDAVLRCATVVLIDTLSLKPLPFAWGARRGGYRLSEMEHVGFPFVSTPPVKFKDEKDLLTQFPYTISKFSIC